MKHLEGLFRNTKNLWGTFRPIVFGLQVIGIFPYNWSKSFSRPKPNVHLALWSLLVNSIMIAGTFLKMQLISEVIKFLNKLSFTIEMISYEFSIIDRAAVMISYVWNSRYLAHFICKWKNLRAQRGRMDSKAFLSIAVSDIYIVLPSFFFIWQVDSYHHFQFENSLRYFLTFYDCVDLCLSTLVMTLFRLTLRILDEELDACVSDAISTEHNNLSSIVSENSITGPDNNSVLRRFHHLTKSIAKIRELQRLTCCYFGLPLLFFFLSILLVLISRVYGITIDSLPVTDVFVGPSSVLMTLFFLCMAAHNHSDHVEQMSTKLQEFSVNINDYKVRDETQRIMQLLEGLRKFEVCGVFVISRSTILQMGCFIATYVVVLLQIN